MLGRVLTNHDSAPAPHVAALVLLYAQPLSRVGRLPGDHPQSPSS